MTPKLRLREAERKALLLEISKSRWPGKSRIMVSMHIMLEPRTHARERQSSFLNRIGLERTYATDACHDPPSSIIVERHGGLLEASANN